MCSKRTTAWWLLSRLSTACVAALSVCAPAAHAEAQALTYGLAGGNEAWPGWARDAVVHSMDEATAAYNQCGYFAKHLTANYNAGVPTAEGGYDGYISFGGSYNTRVAMHEIAHTLGVGTYWGFDGGAWAEDSAAGRLIKLFEGQAAVISTGGTHFWPYGLNFDNEDGAEARRRNCKLVAALRFDMGIVVDSDADALPDDWETFHFESLAHDGASDPDADGISNAHEYATDGDPNLAAPITDGHTYVLRGQITDRVLGVIGASDAEAAATEQRDGDGASHQQWTVAYVGEGYFRFINALSGKVLEVPGSDTASARPVQQATWTGALCQQWRITTSPGAEDGYYVLANRDTARVVDGLDGAEGAPVQQYPLLGNLPQQFWRFEDLAAVNTPSDAGTSDDAQVPADELDADAATAPPSQDAGVLTPEGDADVATSEPDAAVPTGETTTGGPASDRTSSGCSASSSRAPRDGAAWWFAPLALLAIRRKRSRAHSPA